MELNIKKLRARYPAGKFDALAATVRNETAETDAVQMPLVLDPAPLTNPAIAALLATTNPPTP
jgi:hypothetical protein